MTVSSAVYGWITTKLCISIPQSLGSSCPIVYVGESQVGNPIGSALVMYRETGHFSFR